MTTQAVFVSGCDSGFGRALALKLAAAGAAVFAGCYTAEGADDIVKSSGRSPLVVAVRLDVTSDESVAAARRVVDEALAKNKTWVLSALVNNAGLLLAPAPAEWQKVSNYERMMAVNLYGVVRLTNAMLPLLRKSRGRIVVVASIAGRVGLPANAAYSASKFAVSGYAETLRRDLRPFGVSVHIIEPGIFAQTSLYGNFVKGLDETWQGLSPELKADYGTDMYKRVRGGLSFALTGLTNKNPEAVSDAMLHACLSDKPKYRYRVGFDSQYIYPVFASIPEAWSDFIMNSGSKRHEPGAIPASAKHEDFDNVLARYDPEYAKKLAILGVGVSSVLGVAGVVRRALL